MYYKLIIKIFYLILLLHSSNCIKNKHTVTYYFYTIHFTCILPIQNLILLIQSKNKCREKLLVLIGCYVFTNKAIHWI